MPVFKIYSYLEIIHWAHAFALFYHYFSTP